MDDDQGGPAEQDRGWLLAALAKHAVDVGPLRDEPVERLVAHLADARHMVRWRANMDVLAEWGELDSEAARDRWGNATCEAQERRIAELRAERAVGLWADQQQAWLRMWQPASGAS